MDTANKRFFLFRYLGSSIGKKQVMATSGLLLIGFLKTHLLGNLTILIGADAFNTYAHKLMSLGPLLYLAEAILLLLFLVHLLMAFKLTFENKRARGARYFKKKNTGGGANFASSTMPYTGMVIFVFLIIHLITLKYGSHYEVQLAGETVRDLYRTTMEAFSSPLYTAWYAFSMVCLGIHLSHGIQSSFQSLGFNHPLYSPIIKKLSCIGAIFIGFGFAAISVFCYIQSFN